MKLNILHNIYAGLIGLPVLLACSFSVNAVPLDCAGGCSVSAIDPIDGSEHIIRYSATAPSIIDDGFSFKAKMPGGLTEWSVDAQNVLFSQASFYRIGAAGGEINPSNNFNFDDFMSTEDQDEKVIHVVWDGDTSSLRIEEIYRLQTSNDAGRISQVGKDIIITNKTGSPIDLDWFEYTDLDIHDFFDDKVVHRTHAGVDVIDQVNYDTNSIVTTQAWSTMQDGVFIFTQPTAFDLDIFGGKLVEFGGPVTLLDELLDNLPTALDSSPEALGLPGGADLIFGLQYSFEDVIDSVVIRTNMTLLPVPEPSLITLFLFGLPLIAKKRKSKVISG
ncbi:hypothetical protein [Zooshikella sp. RANM57]|uniref:hypothetical protein n=1 Tax=Zooshikella sp. RANM57 TaxID=3425863 RepID=UPI003D6FAC8A